jgi:hypothetical protein
MKTLLLMLLMAGAVLAEEKPAPPCECDACREKRGEKME